jgi:hypothetical protein
MKLLRNKQVVIVCGVVILLGLIFFTSGVTFWPITSTNPPPPPPDWNNPKGTFTLSKENDNFWVNYSLEGQTYSYPVGESTVDLSGYVGERVRIQGTFPSTRFNSMSEDQCVVTSCHKISPLFFGLAGNAVMQVVNIQSVRSL